MFSKACEYGIKATIHIGHQSNLGKRVSLKEVAKAIDSPVAFTAKILQALAKDGIVDSTKGPSGGYSVHNENLALLSIVKAIDGDKIYKGCGLGLKQCNAAKPCPLHHQFVAVRNQLKTMLTTTTISDLKDGVADGLHFLKR